MLEVNIKKQIDEFNLQVTFELSGTRCGIFGSAGSGKSTLMHILAGLQEPDSGTILLDGVSLFDKKNTVNIPPQQRRIGVVFQHAHLFPHLSVQRNLLYGWRRTSVTDRGIPPESIIKALRLSPLLKRSVNTLSGGESQRVALGRTVLASPRLLLMDEPLTGLDDDLKLQIIPYLQEVLNTFQIPMLFISHSLQEIELMTDEVLLFSNGVVQQHLLTKELIAANHKRTEPTSSRTRSKGSTHDRISRSDYPARSSFNTVSEIRQ